MPRQARKESGTGIYHVMLRGINRQDIFEDAEDYMRMLRCMQLMLEQYDAEQMCNAIDGQERAEHFQRLLKEYNEWMQNQQRQQETVQRFLRGYYGYVPQRWPKDV